MTLTVLLEVYFGRENFEFGSVVQEEMPLKGISYLRAPNKLLVNWVFKQPDYLQLRTCKNNCVLA